MKTILTLFCISINVFNACAQLVLTGAGTSTSVANNAPAIFVDNSLQITGSGSIDGARVSVAANFSTGDVLAYTGTLPSGVTAAYNATTGVLTFTGSATPAQYQALLRTVTFKTTSASTSQRTVTFNLGSAISFSGNGHFYEFVTGAFSWADAKTAAASRTFYAMQGYLATITSQSENDFIQQKISADGWIGGSDDYSQINAATGTTTYANQAAAEGKWYWVTGPVGEKGVQFSNGNTTPSAVGGRFMNWNTNEPNNSGGTEHYAEIYSTSSTGKWNDLGASSLGYVVEYGGMAGDPSVSLSASRNILMIAASLQTSPSFVNYQLHATAKFVDEGINVYSAGNITDAKVTIASNFIAGDVLSYSGALPSGVTSGYNAATGVLSFTGTATASQWQALFRTVKFNSTSTTIGNRAISFSLGNLVSGSNGHFYEYVSTTGSWATARTNAAARTYLGLHGYLATVTSQAENDFIKQKIGSDAWIGASDDYTNINAATGTTTYANQAAAEGKWYWVTGPVGEIGVQFSNNNTNPVAVGGNFMNWNGAEPNNSGTGEHCGEIFASGTNPGKWNDLPNANSLGYVVEYGGLASDPLLSLSASRTVAISSVLPVTGLQLTAYRENDGIALKWSTITEINTDHFVLMHSTDGVHFNAIAEMPAAGNSDDVRHYQWKHTQVAEGNNYYQVKLVDIDGRFTLSAIRQVAVSGSRSISVSPNPAHSQILVSYPYSGRPAMLTIRNSSGAIVYRETAFSGQSTIQVGRLTAGLYFIEVGEGSDTKNCRFIVQ